MLTQWKDNKKGISVIEILVVIAIVVIALVSFLGLITFSLRVSTLMKETSQANNLAQETIEAVRNFRDGTDWSVDGLGTLIVGASYYPEKSGDVPPRWQIVAGEEAVNGFIRKVIFHQVYRDADDNIAETGNLDENTRKIIAIVSWRDKEIEIVTYLTNWR